MRVVMPNGARLTFAYLERDADAEQYQGASYTRVYIEEAGNFPSPVPIMKLMATLRAALVCQPAFASRAIQAGLGTSG